MAEENKNSKKEPEDKTKNAVKLDFSSLKVKLPKLKLQKLAVIFGSLIIGIFIGAVIITLFNIGGGISKEVAGESAATYITGNFLAQQGMSAEASEVTDEGSYYAVDVDIMQGSAKRDSAIVYVSKDGKSMFIGSAYDLTEELSPITGATTAPPPEVPKSDKPKAEAFIFSYCPYGLQFEKALLPVYEALKDKADIELIAIGAMHGEYEKVESLRQICVEKEYSTDKMWAYLEKFMSNTGLGNCRGTESCVSPIIENIFRSLGIDKNKINSCMETDAEEIYEAQNARAAELGASGSPTFIINDVKVQVERSSEAIKEAICDAFNEAPEECEQELSAQAVTPGFGYSESSSSNSGSC